MDEQTRAYVLQQISDGTLAEDIAAAQRVTVQEVYAVCGEEYGHDFEGSADPPDEYCTHCGAQARGDLGLELPTAANGTVNPRPPYVPPGVVVVAGPLTPPLAPYDATAPRPVPNALVEGGQLGSYADNGDGTTTYETTPPWPCVDLSGAEGARSTTDPDRRRSVYGPEPEQPTTVRGWMSRHRSRFESEPEGS